MLKAISAALLAASMLAAPAFAATGKITKVSVAGPFAGTPVADCVANAVRTVSFPPWDGAPESFNYSFLLSE